MHISQGDIVLVPFPFTDLSSVKTRPAIVLSNRGMQGEDVILCALTSQSNGVQEIKLINKDLGAGTLPLVSYIRYAKLVTISERIIRKKVATLGPVKLRQLLKAVVALLQLS